MSFFEIQQKCNSCGMQWPAMFGIVGTSEIGSRQTKCPQCGSTDLGGAEKPAPPAPSREACIGAELPAGWIEQQGLIDASTVEEEADPAPQPFVPTRPCSYQEHAARIEKMLAEGLHNGKRWKPEAHARYAELEQQEEKEKAEAQPAASAWLQQKKYINERIRTNDGFGDGRYLLLSDVLEAYAQSELSALRTRLEQIHKTLTQAFFLSSIRQISDAIVNAAKQCEAALRSKEGK